jgi:hypothetical protein
MIERNCHTCQYCKQQIGLHPCAKCCTSIRRKYPYWKPKTFKQLMEEREKKCKEMGI